MTGSLKDALLARVEAAATWKCDTPADSESLGTTPADLASLLLRVNGCVLFDGGLHIRGTVRDPQWHSLAAAWKGDGAFTGRYGSVESSDIPFAQDCVGDQFLLRNGKVHRLSAETDETLDLDLGLGAFLEAALADPVEFLQLAPLTQLRNNGGELLPGQLVNVAPPYCVKHEGTYSFRAIPASDQLAYLADLAAEIRRLPDGANITIVPTQDHG